VSLCRRESNSIFVLSVLNLCGLCVLCESYFLLERSGWRIADSQSARSRVYPQPPVSSPFLSEHSAEKKGSLILLSGVIANQLLSVASVSGAGRRARTFNVGLLKRWGLIEHEFMFSTVMAIFGRT
jgi:hypothetical protein